MEGWSFLCTLLVSGEAARRNKLLLVQHGEHPVFQGPARLHCLPHGLVITEDLGGAAAGHMRAGELEGREKASKCACRDLFQACRGGVLGHPKSKIAPTYPYFCHSLVRRWMTARPSAATKVATSVMASTAHRALACPGLLWELCLGDARDAYPSPLSGFVVVHSCGLISWRANAL